MRNGSIVTKPTVKKFAICSKNNQTWHKTVKKLPDFLLQRIKLWENIQKKLLIKIDKFNFVYFNFVNLIRYYIIISKFWLKKAVYLAHN